MSYEEQAQQLFGTDPGFASTVGSLEKEWPSLDFEEE